MLHTDRLRKLDCLYEKAKAKLIEHARENNQREFWRVARIANRVMAWKIDLLR